MSILTMLDLHWFDSTSCLVVCRGDCWLLRSSSFACILQRQGPNATCNLGRLCLPTISSSPAGNTQSLQAETGRSHQLADGLQQLHTSAEEDTKGSEAQPATVMRDLEGEAGMGCFFFLKGWNIWVFIILICIVWWFLLHVILESPPSITGG